MRHWRLLLGIASIGLLIATSLSLVGCEEGATTTGRKSQQELRRWDRGEALLSNAAAHLANLPAAVDTELHPPAVILDSSKSANGQEVYALCTPTPNEPEGPINLVTVPAGNARFRSLGVQSGDVVKYYLLEDETVDEERRRAGFSSQLATEFTVAQVLDENALLLEKGVPPAVAEDYMDEVLDEETPLDEALPRGVLVPAKIEIWRNLDDRLIEINQKLQLYANRRLPRIGWQPSPDEQVIDQIVAWLNQWLRQSEPKTDWQPDTMLQTLGDELAKDEALAPYLSQDYLAAQAFEPYDGRLLQEAVWHRDISRWAQGDNFNEIARAAALFDWVVRNIQLVPETEAAAYRPWQVLLHGRGTAEQRAWVFAMLCRQQGLDVVILTLPNNGDRFWLPALFVDDQLYLFDTRLGLPIPANGGEGVATLEQVRSENALLRQLDLEGTPYPVTSEMLKEVTPRVVTDPFSLTRRARQVEVNLTGEDHLVLTTRPGELATRLNSVPGLSDSQLWEMPFRTLREQLNRGAVARHRAALAFEPFAVRPQLWKARALHFQGRRPVGQQSPEEAPDDHREAAQLYTSKSVRPTDSEIMRTESPEKRRVDEAAKLNATYWVGLLSFDDGRYEVAAHWLGRPELMAPQSPWTDGARYNLARTYEAQGKLKEAAELLENSADSPQRQGNLLRARSLKQQAESAASN